MGRKSSKSFSISTLKKIKSLNGRYKRSRTPPVSKCCKDEPDPDLYAIKIELIAELEKLSKQRLIDLCYGDETGSPANHVCSQGYVPYGWQFPDEDCPLKRVIKSILSDLLADIINITGLSQSNILMQVSYSNN